MRKRLFAMILAALLPLTLPSCGGDAVPGEMPQEFRGDGGRDFQKAMHQSAFGDLNDICQSETGYYFQFDSSLYYLEGESGRATILCARPDCAHDDDTCNARAGAYALWYSGGQLYFARRDFEMSGGAAVEHGKHIYSLNPDGTGLRQVTDLELGHTGGTLSSFDTPICHRGMLYFVYNGVIYRMPLEGGSGEAERLWGEEYIKGGNSGGYAAQDPNEPRYTLWADGDTLYFMVNAPQDDGVRRDVLYAYDLLNGTAAKVWEVPSAEVTGEWETTGVKATKWYILEGAIYFYLSGGDFWRTDLSTGESVKLADTHERTLYGTAVFSDDCMCLINDHPMIDPVTGDYWLGSGLREGGDRVFLYSLEGELIRELPLTALFDELGDISGAYPVFCGGGALYLVADAGRMVPIPAGSGQQKSRCDVLCRLDLETGEITEAARWEDWT